MEAPPERNPDALVDLPLPVHAFVHLRLAQQGDGAALDDAGPYPSEHVLAALPLEDDALDSPQVEKLRQQETGGAGADDSDLCLHGGPFPAQIRVDGRNSRKLRLRAEPCGAARGRHARSATTADALFHDRGSGPP